MNTEKSEIEYLTQPKYRELFYYTVIYFLTEKITSPRTWVEFVTDRKIPIMKQDKKYWDQFTVRFGQEVYSAVTKNRPPEFFNQIYGWVKLGYLPSTHFHTNKIPKDKGRRK